MSLILQPNTSLILGLGKTGLSCVRYFVARNLPVAVLDNRQEPPGLSELHNQFPSVPIQLGEFPLEILLQAKQLIVSPGLSLEEPAIAAAMKQGIPVLGDIELFVREAKAPVIAITGTNAKGTVTTLVGEMLRHAQRDVRVGGNIGVPALDLLGTDEPAFYVLELSSFQLETTFSLKAEVATILNISADHLDRYDSIASYIAAKHRVYREAQIVVYNRDDQNTYPQNPGSAQQISFGLKEAKAEEFGIMQTANGHALCFGNHALLNVDQLRIKGRHNWANALAALAIGHAIHLPMQAMLEALQTFPGLTHRCEWITENNGVAWYNDSKGTNVGATKAAIEGIGSAIAGKVVLIAGGVGKGADFSPLVQSVKQFVRTAILFGQDADVLNKVFATTTSVIHASSLQQAVLLANKAAKAGDAILFSPACASFDMFRNAEERGEQFKAIVRSMHERGLVNETT